MVGVAAIASLKAAVIVTVSVEIKKSSESVSVNFTVGGVPSKVISIVSVPALTFPARS